ncbi:type II toxin-antitoxin system HicA family toxin [Nitrosomonas oligotropha]|uniref:type II toxin-antitoxin system HicA family toxin n=1 Tax=Nitrosomonas oligotropha TaxID=42354 RepID=UPI0013708BF4|nr:type II toxin-antitoxin system HicA family toxin [Nitrosomonas oligotropha]MXS83265.1 type II toxin-antitoxin system HicA family toxin [Nitrosomonas oligotropha]
MGKLRVLSGQQLCAILAQHGFIEVWRRGSHVVMQKKMDTQRLPDLIPNHSEVRIGTLQFIIRQSGIAKSEFEIL